MHLLQDHLRLRVLKPIHPLLRVLLNLILPKNSLITMKLKNGLKKDMKMLLILNTSNLKKISRMRKI